MDAPSSPQRLSFRLNAQASEGVLTSLYSPRMMKATDGQLYNKDYFTETYKNNNAADHSSEGTEAQVFYYQPTRKSTSILSSIFGSTANRHGSKVGSSLADKLNAQITSQPCSPSTLPNIAGYQSTSTANKPQNRDLSTLARIGWQFSQGWNNRPEVAVKGCDEVRNDMKQHAERLKKAADLVAAKSGRIPGNNNGNDKTTRRVSTRVSVVGDRHIDIGDNHVSVRQTCNRKSIRLGATGNGAGAVAGMTYGIDGPA